MQKINNITNCRSGDAIVSYIYNELPSADRLAFEDHLLDCTTCTDEFAAIAYSRYSVYEWQKIEFEPMQTPNFVIPYAETKVSWFDALKTIFATGPRLATAGAFGLLIVAVGFAAIFLSAGPTDVVSTSDIQVTDTFPVPAAPTVNNTSVASVPAPVEPEERVSPEFAVSKLAPKIEQRRKPSTVRRNAPRPQNIGNETQAKAPRLNDFDDLADDSLRLADLVADSDTRD
jgi:hypothetical protein